MKFREYLNTPVNERYGKVNKAVKDDKDDKDDKEIANQTCEEK